MNDTIASNSRLFRSKGRSHVASSTMCNAHTKRRELPVSGDHPGHPGRLSFAEVLAVGSVADTNLRRDRAACTRHYTLVQYVASFLADEPQEMRAAADQRGLNRTYAP